MTCNNRLRIAPHPNLEPLESRLTPDSSTQAIVTGMYHQMLLRGPDQAGLNAYTRALNEGASIGDIAKEIYASPEFRQNQIQHYYENLLDRPGETKSVAAWVDQLFAGYGEERVAAQIASSPEYTARWGNPAELVNRWYVDLLGRQPDSAGLSAHTMALQSGHTPLEVATAFTQSAEYRSVKVRSVYLAALGRDADSVGLKAWVGNWQILGGLGGVTSKILNSPENRARLISPEGINIPNLELARQWATILRAPYNQSANGFVNIYNRLLETRPLYDTQNDPIPNQPLNIALWDFSKSTGGNDGLPDDEKRLVTSVNKPVAFPVLNLLPTQNEVDMDQSLKYPLTNPGTLELYLQGGDIEHPRGLIITGGNGRYVLNGHHRWSTIYCFNPHASIMSVDIGLESRPEDYLKITQIAVGANLGFLPVANAADNNNLFDVPESQFRDYVKSTILGNTDGGQAILGVFTLHGFANMEAIQDYLWKNVLELRQNNRPAIDIPREIMPQPLNDDPAPIAILMRSGTLNYKAPLFSYLG